MEGGEEDVATRSALNCQFFQWRLLFWKFARKLLYLRLIIRLNRVIFGIFRLSAISPPFFIPRRRYFFFSLGRLFAYLVALFFSSLTTRGEEEFGKFLTDDKFS